MSLMRARNARYPSRTSPWTWLLFHYVDPAYADTLSARLKQDAIFDAYYEMINAVDIPRPGSVIRQYQFALAIGDRVRAQHVLEAARKAGVALPDLVGRQLKA